MNMTPGHAARILRALQDVTDLAAIDDHGCRLLALGETFEDAVHAIIVMLEQQAGSQEQEVYHE